MVNLLILSAGTNAAFHFIRTIKNNFQDKIRVIGVDINEKHTIASSIFLDSFYMAPLSSDEKYYGFILNICKKERIDYLMPILDIDQIMFYKENLDLNEINVKVLGLSKKLACLYADKEKMNVFLAKNHFLVPKSFSLENIKDNEIYFIKPKKGYGSIGADIKLGADIKKINDICNFLIQEICSGPEYTVECFRYQKFISCITRERIQAKSGVCVKAKVCHMDEIEKMVKKIAQIIPECPMFFNVQFMKNRENRFVITDINLRLAGGMSISKTAGWDEASAIAHVLLGSDLDKIESCFGFSHKECFVMRAYCDYITECN
ncbi:ATP-grasp domain-containing protein [Campylobacter coli]